MSESKKKTLIIIFFIIYSILLLAFVRFIYNVTGIAIPTFIALVMWIGIYYLIAVLIDKFISKREASKSKFNYEYNRNGKNFTIYSNINIDSEANAIEDYIDEDEMVLSAIAGVGGYGNNAILICTTKGFYYYDKGYPLLSTYPLGAGLRCGFIGNETVSLKEKKSKGSYVAISDQTGMWPFILDNVPRPAAEEMYYTLQNEIKRATLEKQGKEN